jgi:2-phospho-L-lactate guanylyltransferase
MIIALVPAKALDQAKGRLAELLSEDERRRLALAMLEDVLGALRGVPAIDSVYVVSPDAEVLEAARNHGAIALEEPPSVRGINQALAQAASSVPSADALLVVLADVPAVTSAELASVIEQAPDKGVVICPSSAKGTSALFLRPPGVIPFRFGELSFQAHKRQAAALRIETRVLHIESLEHDIDEPDDLRWLSARSGETATQRLLAKIMPAERTA